MVCDAGQGRAEQVRFVAAVDLQKRADATIKSLEARSRRTAFSVTLQTCAVLGSDRYPALMGAFDHASQCLDLAPTHVYVIVPGATVLIRVLYVRQQRRGGGLPDVPFRVFVKLKKN